MTFRHLAGVIVPTGVVQHSLSTRVRSEAMTNLAQLDVAMAKKHGIPGARSQTVGGEVPLEAGWKKYLSDRAKPLNLGGTADSTVKKYRCSSQKHIAFAKKQAIETWNQIRDEHVEQYAEH